MDKLNEKTQELESLGVKYKELHEKCNRYKKKIKK